MFISTNVVYVVLALFSVSAKADIVAFSGDTCNGGEGANVACDDGCVSFQNRHSFQVLASGTHCVTVFEDTACSTPVGSYSNPGSGACTNVNTGTNVQSFRCSPNSACDGISAGISGTNLTIAGTAKPLASLASL